MVSLARIDPYTAKAEDVPLPESASEFFNRVSFVAARVTDACNIQCTYCNAEAGCATSPKMPIGTFRRFCDAYIPSSKYKCIIIEFHGGEPTLMSDAWFKEAVNYAKEKAFLNEKELTLGMQTNGTLMSEKRLLMFHELGIQLGLSCDGPPEINDRRRDKGDLVGRTLALAQKHKIGLGLTLVLHPGNYNHIRESMDYFAKYGIRGYHMNFLESQGRNEEGLTVDMMFEGACTAFDYMADTNCSVVEARVTQMVNRLKLGRRTGVHSCTDMECGAGKWFIGMDWTGTISPCDTHIHEFAIGDLWNGFDLPSVEQQLLEFHRKGPWYLKCFSCEARKICTFSCAMSVHKNPVTRDAECEFTIRFHKYLLEHWDAVEKVYSKLSESPKNRHFR
jgi:uncharacterized protein